MSEYCSSLKIGSKNEGQREFVADIETAVRGDTFESLKFSILWTMGSVESLKFSILWAALPLMYINTNLFLGIVKMKSQKRNKNEFSSVHNITKNNMAKRRQAYTRNGRQMTLVATATTTTTTTTTAAFHSTFLKRIFECRTTNRPLIFMG